MDILFEDDSIIVCHKPANLATQTRQIGQQDMESQLKNYLAAKEKNPEIYVVHRLDQPVEGLMVFAKNKQAAAELSKQIQDGSFKKKYYAIVTALDIMPEGLLEDYVIKDSKTNLARVVNKSQPNSKKAKLGYRVIDEWENRKLLDIELFTGRYHQIRVQFASRKAPLLGDRKYGGEESKAGISLCSHYISFKHPVTKKQMEFDVVPHGLVFQESSVMKELLG